MYGDTAQPLIYDMPSFMYSLYQCDREPKLIETSPTFMDNTNNFVINLPMKLFVVNSPIWTRTMCFVWNALWQNSLEIEYLSTKQQFSIEISLIDAESLWNWTHWNFVGWINALKSLSILESNSLSRINNHCVVIRNISLNLPTRLSHSMRHW